MSDPLSIASGIAGLISLGLQTCQGIVTYYQAWSDYDEDVATTATAVKQLNGILQTLRDTIKTDAASGPAAINAVLSSIQQCEDGIKRLQKLLTKIETKHPQTQLTTKQEVVKRLTDYRKRLLYPFRQGTLGKLRDIVSELRGNLDPALHNLQVNIAKDTSLSIRLLRDEHKAATLSEENERIISWLSPLEFSQRQKEILSRRHSETGSWLLQTTEFADWRDFVTGSIQGLWCTGKMGSGKSTMASVVVEHLQRLGRRGDFAVIYIYCNWQESSAQSPQSLIGSLVQQLVECHEIMPKMVKRLYEEHKKGRVVLTVDEGLSLFQTLLQNFKATYVCIDGLDELSASNPSPHGNTSRLLLMERALQKLFDFQGPGRLAVFVTSRFSQQASSTKDFYTPIEFSALDSDLTKFVRTELLDVGDSYPWTNPELALRVQEDQQLLNKIVESCVNHADKAFLLPRLYINALKDQSNLRQLRKALESLSIDLGTNIKEAINRIECQSSAIRDIGMNAIRWVAYALRPLSMRELQHALAIASGDEEFVEDGISPSSIILASCAGLITLEPESGVVRLLHFSVREYLEGARKWRHAESELEIVEKCITYLSFPTFMYVSVVDNKIDNETKGLHETWDMDKEKQAESVEKEMLIQTAIKRFPLLAYASQHWGLHARSTDISSLHEVLLSFLLQDGRANFSFNCLFQNLYGSSRICPDNVNGLHLAAFFGLDTLVAKILETGIKPDSCDSSGRAALYFAATKGHTSVVKMLLQAGVNVTGRLWPTPGFLGLLRSKGPVMARTWWHPPWAQVSRSGNALQAAAEQGHIEIVQLLLSAGANPNARGEFHATCLEAAVFKGHRKAVQVLLQSDAVVQGSTIQAAVYSGNTDILASLINNLPDDVQPAYSSLFFKSFQAANSRVLDTALYAAGLLGRIGCAQILIQNGADVNALTEGFYCTPLQAAASQNQTMMIEFLLEQGASVDRVSQESVHHHDARAHRVLFDLDEADLHAALRPRDLNAEIDLAGYIPSSEQKLMYKASGTLATPDKVTVLRADKRHGTALQSAASGGHRETVEMLIQRGADVNVYSGYYGTALQAAAARGHYGVVKQLLDAKAHVNTLTGFYGDSLKAAAANGSLEVMRLLLDAGAEINARGGEYGFALHAAARGASLNIVKFLIGRGANVNAKGGIFNNALTAAAIGLPGRSLEEATTKYIDISGPQPPEYFLMIAQDEGMMSNARTWPVFGNLLSAAAGGSFGPEQQLLLGEDFLHRTDKIVREVFLSSADNYDVLKLLIDEGADVHVRGGHWGTPLISASFAGRLRLVRLLVESGVDVNVPNPRNNALPNNPHNAIDAAYTMGHIEVKDYLKEVGCIDNIRPELWDRPRYQNSSTNNL